MAKLSDICAEAERFDCVLILPEPRPTAPWGPFKVTKASLKPTERYGTLRYSRDWKDGWKYRSARLARGDCLLHVPTGTVVSVVQALGRFSVQVEGWTEPDSEKERDLWAARPGLGNWVVWGTAFRTISELPPHARPGEVISGENLAQARMDLFKHPERKPWGVQGLLKRVKGNKRKKARRQLRKLLGTLKTVQDIQDIDALIERGALQMVKAKNGGEFVRWRLKEPE